MRGKERERGGESFSCVFVNVRACVRNIQTDWWPLFFMVPLYFLLVEAGWKLLHRLGKQRLLVSKSQCATGGGD